MCLLYCVPHKLKSLLLYLLPPEGIVFSCVCMLGFFFVSNTTVFLQEIIQDTSTKLSGIICRPPEQIKFEYHDSNSLLWLHESKKPILDLDLDLELSMPSHPWTYWVLSYLGVSHPVNDYIMDLTLALYEYIMLFCWTVLWVHDVMAISKLAVESVMFWTGFIWINLIS